MDTVEEQVLEGLRALPTERKQEVLNFIGFLRTKTLSPIPESHTSPLHASSPAISALERGRQWAGCLDGGPEDLSTNKAYLEGYGT